MSYVIATPEIMTAAATDLATVGSTLDAAHLAAAPTLAVTPAAADEVSTGIAQLFSQHAQDYHVLARQAAAFGEQFTENLKTSAAGYTSIEDFIAWTLRATSSNLSQFTAPLRQFTAGLLEQLAPFMDWLADQFDTAYTRLLDLIPDPIRAVLGVGVLLGFLLFAWALDSISTASLA
jgi:hypothetical protein